MSHESIRPDAPHEAARKRAGGETLAQSAMAYIESHYKERFSLQAIAGELFVNGSYLLRVFKKNTGFTLLAYHNHVRCERARELLGHTGESVSDIGEKVGFVSSAHFSHVFKKTEGCTPSEYRIRSRGCRETESAGL